MSGTGSNWNTPTRSYKNPFNSAVGGNLTLHFSLASEKEKKRFTKASLKDSRAPHVSAPPIDLSFLKIAASAEVLHLS